MDRESYELHLISNTHWDREWLYDFQETRMMLVEFFDRLLDILDRRSEYRAFLLDSQVVPVEDYLEVRPEARPRIEKHVRAGRLQIGPWYTCPEGFIVNGESLVRNLLYGHRVAAGFGGAMKVGHTPFSYGQNSQMPQIYAGFGIDTILFYHGVSHDEVPNEFIFEGADGTRVFASQMSSFARYNFYFAVYRPVVYGTAKEEREYHWEQGGVPFHLCGEGNESEHHFLLDPPRKVDWERLGDLLRKIKEEEIRTASTRYLALMMGHDSSLPDEIEIEIVRRGRDLLPGDELRHSSLPELMEKVKSAAKDLRVLKGERRTPKLMNGRVHLYSDVLSSRTRIKQLNAKAELLLQRKAEPFAALAWILGSEYPASLLDLAWKWMLRSHAHDSIAGSGVDEIERDVTYRLRQTTNISRGILKRSLQNIAIEIDLSRVKRDDLVVTVFNPSPFTRSEILSACLDIPREWGIREFDLEDPESGTLYPVQVSTRRPFDAVVNHAGDAPARMEAEKVCFHFSTGEVPALGYRSYRLNRNGTFLRGSLVTGLNTLENEHLRVRIERDGTLTVLHKDSGREYSDLHFFEDGGEAGHAWMHIEPDTDRIVTSRGFPVEIALVEDGPLLARYRVACRMEIPKGLDENRGDPWKRLDGAGSCSRRTDETCSQTLFSEIILRAGARSVEIRTRLDNRARDHRLRVLFPTRLDSDRCCVEGAFDVVERSIVHGPESPWYGGVNATFPMHRFVDVSDRSGGLAVINDGLREYEVTATGDRSIALTLLRAYEVSLTTVSRRWERHPEMELSQCPGFHEFRYWIYPHSGNWIEGGVFEEVENRTLSLEPAQMGRHEGTLPPSGSFLALTPSKLILTAVKRSEDGKGIVIRVFNPTDQPLDGKVSTRFPLSAATLVTLEEKPVEELSIAGNEVCFSTPGKKILTLRLDFGPS